jgi:hypothetical protein
MTTVELPISSGEPEYDSAEPTHARGRSRSNAVETACVLLILAFGAGISWIRLSPTTRGTLWAEDVRNFIGNAVRSGPVTPLMHPYAGYLQLLPRLIADATVAAVPVSGWALSMAAGSCVVTAACAAVVFVCSREITNEVVIRLLLAGITLLDPLAPREVLGNTANLHWYFLWMTPWLLLYRPRSRVGGWVLGAVALLAALSEIQMVLFVPLLLWRWRDRPRMPIRGLYLAGVVAQLIATISVPRATSAGHLLGPGALAYGYLINGVMTIFDPNPKAVGFLITLGGPVIGLMLLMPFAVATGYVLVSGSAVQRILASALGAGSLVLYPLAVEISPGPFYDYPAMSRTQLADPWLARYGVVPSMFLIALIPLACAVWARQHRTTSAAGRPSIQRSILVPTVLLSLMILLVVHLVPAATRRSGGPVLATQVTAQEAACTGQPVDRPVTLVGDPGPGWKVELTCGYLRDHH